MLDNESALTFFIKTMNPNLQAFLKRNAPYHRIPTDIDNFYEQEYKDYYSPPTFSSVSSIFRPPFRHILVYILGLLFVFTLLFVLFRGNEENSGTYNDLKSSKYEDTTVEEIQTNGIDFQNAEKEKENSNFTTPEMKLKAQTLAVAKPDAKLALDNYLKSIDPRETYPDDVNSVKPHHIRVIGAMGDSLTIGYCASHFIERINGPNPGNSFFTGIDEEIDGHLSIYNIFRVIAEETGNKLFGGSTGVGYGNNTGLNVAVGGMKSDDILRQAKDLVSRIKANKEINIEKDWKLVSLWIGTNDVGNLVFGSENPIPVKEYKAFIEEGLLYLKKNLPRTIVSIIGMFPPQLLQEAYYILRTGNRPGTPESRKQLDELCDSYRNASYEIQNEGKFDDREFTVVVQPFGTEYTDAFRNEFGNYSSALYAYDVFHLGKLGQAIVAKHYWQNLFEPVGEKTKRAELGNITPEIFGLSSGNSLIKTLGNSKK
ncbi:Lipase_GDSL domain-containing protein [Caenorhabditis elegans]|uniref:Lipase_GDSL domain-containing protein n=1 Tax=Caenorhabditis elegans TaxID=6239 RepID=A5JYU3_CAEEL|nr:Lipase_GDSL domain-containing protein [Caenorhabditis elegans]CAN86627.1 Lipase_GDSL domain-containing protein [Caenorhabditis elegans]|eukprot:NP_001122986.1 Uncharacterized protein CELE_R07B7.9 [Caenorhabditis elegans]